VLPNRQKISLNFTSFFGEPVVMADSNKSETSSWSKFSGGALTLPAATALLYVLGKSYYNALILQLGFSPPMFEIPLQDICFVTWSKVSMTAFFVAVGVYLWTVRPLFEFVIRFFFNIIVGLFAIPFRFACRAAFVEKSWGYIKVRMNHALNAAADKVPDGGGDLNPVNGRIATVCVVFVLAFMAFIYAYDHSLSEANAFVAKYHKSEKREITLVGRDNRIISGFLVIGIGNMIVVDTVDYDGKPQRQLIDKRDIQSSTRHPSGPPSDPHY
jgi:hypothetical protein